jgi:hypothetical protein
MVTALLAVPLSLSVIFSVFFGEWRQPIELIAMTGMYSLWISPFIILYGLPVTCLADFVSKRLSGQRRMYLSLLIHLLFGVFFGVVLPMGTSFSWLGVQIDSASIFASITGLFFWVVDEILRRYKL